MNTKKNLKILLPFFYLMPLFCFSQEKLTISGYIKDANNGETLIGATAYIPNLQNGVTSNEYGFYSLAVDKGNYEIIFSYVGFNDVRKNILLSDNHVQLDIELQLEANKIEEVVISGEAKDKNVTNVEMSVNKLDIKTIKGIPSLLGEVEIIRSLQLLPGVSSVGEGAAGFNVRGGSIDQNLVLLDEAPVYNSSHLFGFFSVFNPDAVKDVKLYKGGIPARYGGRLSSILDVRMKEGNSKKIEMNGGIGTVFSRLSLEAPLIKNKASFIIAGRRSYIDVLAAPFLSEDFEDTVLNFYDLTLKSNYKLNESNKFFVSGYFGRDNFGFGNQAGFSWGNSTGTFRWNHLFSQRLFSNLTFFYSDYDYKISFGDDAINRFDWDASIDNLSIKPEFTFFLSPGNILRFGGQFIYYEFEPGNAVGVSEGEIRDISLPKKYSLESALYIENELDITHNLTTNYGIRYSYFDYIGTGTSYTFGDSEPGERREISSSTMHESGSSIQTYHNLEPRFSLKYQLNETSSLKTSYNRTAQYIHLISNTTAATPVDVWTPSTNNIKPQIADQVALGYFRNFKNNLYEFNTEVYYKKMVQLVDYIDGADLLLNVGLEGDLLEGTGRAYGAEFQLKKNEGRFNGWISYTLSRTERLVEGINGDEWYPARFDQTHNMNITSFYEFNDRWSMSSNFTFITGTPTSFFDSRFEQQDYVIPHSSLQQRNNVRIPNYHRLDFSFTWKGKDSPEKKWLGEWVFSIYNIYSRRNAFSIYFQQQADRVLPNQMTNTNASQLSVVGNFIPSISYNFKFK